MSRRCPEDLTPLQARAFGTLSLDACPECAGIFFDEGEIGELQRAGSSGVEAVEVAFEPGGLAFIDSPVPKRCPGCAAPMRVYTYRYSSDIRLDGCDCCGGVWVQDGELAQIAEHLRVSPTTFGGTPAARQAAVTRNSETRERNEAARRHAGLLSRALNLMGL